MPRANTASSLTPADRAEGPVTDAVVDPRSGLDRRQTEGTSPTGLERRRGRGRRLSDFSRSAEQGEMTPEQFLFLVAIDEFKKANGKTFPTWTDVLEVIRLLGYRKTQPSDLNLTRAEDWSERPDAPAGVRPDKWAERFTNPPQPSRAFTTDPETGPIELGEFAEDHEISDAELMELASIEDPDDLGAA